MKSLDIQEKQVTRLTQLVEELLDVTRIQAGKFDYLFEEVDVSQLVNDIADRYADEFKAANCKLSLKATKDLIVRADPFRLDQVIVNLITNALKSAAGTPIEIQTIQDDRFAKIIVKDMGKGISADTLMKIFDRFERAEADSNITG